MEDLKPIVEPNQVKPLLKMRSITKRFPGVLALSKVNLDVFPFSFPVKGKGLFTIGII